MFCPVVTDLLDAPVPQASWASALFPSTRQSLRKYTLLFTVAAAQVDACEMSIPQSVMIIRFPGMLIVELLVLLYVHGVAPVM